jgi:polysaccharide biosynthesis transport protein
MKGETLPALTGKNGHLAAVTSEGFPMTEPEQETSSSGVNLHEILFILFRHKWKILICAAAGMVAAAAVYILLPPVYESEGKLFVRYVVDKSAVDGLDADIKTPNSQTDTLINSEVEILTSLDLAREVAQAIGVEQLLPGAGAKATLENATKVVSRGLGISIVKGTSIISLSFRSTDPKLPTAILQELVKRYFDKHLEVHRSVGAFEFVTKETEELRRQLNQTEGELNELKSRAGVISLVETKATLASELGKSQEALDTAEGELAAQQSLVKVLETSLAVTEPSSTDTPKTETQPRPVSGDIVQKYQSLVSRVTQLQQAETELLSRYTPENRLVKVKQGQIADLDKQRRDLEKKYPALINTVVAATSSSQGAQGARPDLLSERARLVGLQSRVDALRTRVSGLKQRASLISELGPRIEELERKKEVEDTNYKHSQSSLEKARIDETLDPSRMPNISVVQAPSPAAKVTRDVKKFVIGLAGGGLALGIAIALLIELVLDRTVKRSFELERRLRVPLLLSIPDFGSNGQRLRLHDAGQDSQLVGDENSREDLDSLDSGELLRPFCEAIRDRLGLFFELNNMSHKPKLVAVTGLAKNAGASTLAAGLASTLSEGADSRVLLVDKPVSPKRFYSMLADFKASDLDYVVFDMPSLGDTSSTLPLAGFMDTVLLVVEAGKSNRDAVKRAYTQLAAKTKVSVVFNKSRSYGPKWLEGEP